MISYHQYPWLWHRFRESVLQHPLASVSHVTIDSHLTPTVLKISPTRPSSLQPSLTTFARSNYTTHERPTIHSGSAETVSSQGGYYKGSLEILCQHFDWLHSVLPQHLPTRLEIFRPNSPGRETRKGSIVRDLCLRFVYVVRIDHGIHWRDIMAIVKAQNPRIAYAWPENHPWPRI